MGVANDLALGGDVYALACRSTAGGCHSQRRARSCARSSSPAPRSDSRHRRPIALAASTKLVTGASTTRRRRGAGQTAHASRPARRSPRGTRCGSTPSCSAAATTPTASRRPRPRASRPDTAARAAGRERHRAAPAASRRASRAWSRSARLLDDVGQRAEAHRRRMKAGVHGGALDGVGDVVAVTDVQHAVQGTSSLAVLGVHAQDPDEARAGLSLQLDFDRSGTSRDLQPEIRSMRDARRATAIAVPHVPSPERVFEDLSLAPPVMSAQLKPCAHPRARAGVRPCARRHRPRRPARRVPRPCRSDRGERDNDPSPLVIRTVRTRPAAVSRRAWSYVTVRPQPMTRPHGSSGDTPTRASHSRPSSDLRPGSPAAPLTAPASDAPRAHSDHESRPALAQCKGSLSCPSVGSRSQPPIPAGSLPPPTSSCPRLELLSAPGCPC